MTYKLHFVLTAASRYVSSLSMLILNCHLCLKRYKNVVEHYEELYFFENPFSNVNLYRQHEHGSEVVLAFQVL